MIICFRRVVIFAFVLSLFGLGIELQYLGVFFELFFGGDDLLIDFCGQSTFNVVPFFGDFQSVAIRIVIEPAFCLIGLMTELYIS